MPLLTITCLTLKALRLARWLSLFFLTRLNVKNRIVWLYILSLVLTIRQFVPWTHHISSHFRFMGLTAKLTYWISSLIRMVSSDSMFCNGTAPILSNRYIVEILLFLTLLKDNLLETRAHSLFHTSLAKTILLMLYPVQLPLYLLMLLRLRVLLDLTGQIYLRQLLAF